jgi:type I restriction enzyme S subunit
MELTRLKYKATEIGLIPDDWEMKTLGEVGDVRMCKRIFNYQTSERGDIPFFKIGTFGKEPDAYISSTLYNEFRRKYSFPKKGTVLISAAGTIGRTIVYDGNDAYFQDSNIVWIDNNNQIISDEYLKHVFPFVKFNTEGGTIQRLYNSILKSGRFPAPPTLTEQKAIATALSDVDTLISSLEKLIAKKKAIKQGAMQQLLTPPHKGGKRLAGFSGEWEEKKLGEITKIKTGTKNNQDKINEGLYPFYVRSQNVEKINSYSYDCEAILVPGEGGIGSIFHYINGKFEVHQRVYKISDFQPEILGFYIYLQMKYSFGKHAMTNTVKATVDSLRLPTFEVFLVPIPPTIEEQKTIAQILSDMDLEIESLEVKKEKYQQIKQGVMQELLTGKTRLV